MAAKWNVHVTGKNAQRCARLKEQGVPVSAVVEAALTFFFENCASYDFKVSKQEYTRVEKTVSVQVAS